MKANEKVEKFISWAESTRTTAGRRGMLVEIKNGKILLLNREKTVALLSDLGGSEELRFYSDEYPLGKYPDVTSDGTNIIFSWIEGGQTRKVSFPLPDKSYFEEVIKTFDEQRKVEGELQTYKIDAFSNLLEDMKFTTLEFTPDGLRLLQTDPRGITSETKIKSDAGVVKEITTW